MFNVSSKMTWCLTVMGSCGNKDRGQSYEIARFWNALISNMMTCLQSWPMHTHAGPHCLHCPKSSKEWLRFSFFPVMRWHWISLYVDRGGTVQVFLDIVFSWLPWCSCKNVGCSALHKIIIHPDIADGLSWIGCRLPLGMSSWVRQER